MSAIITKFLCATPTKGARMQATIELDGKQRKATVPYDFECNSTMRQYWQAAEALIKKLPGRYYRASLWRGAFVESGKYMFIISEETSIFSVQEK